MLIPPQNNGSGGPLQTLYGIEKEQDDLLSSIEKCVFVSVCGVPGVGKSALVQNAAKIFQNRSYTVRHIDMSDSNISNLIKLLYTSFDQVESAADERKSNDKRIEQWLRNVVSFEPAILILDNLDGEWIIHHDTLHDLLIQPLIKSHIPSKLKVIVTSQYCFELKGPHHKIIPLLGIDDDSCADWISTDYAIISYSNGKHLCHILDGIPLAVKLVVSFIADPSRSHEYTADKIVRKLNSSEYNEFFEYLVEHKIISEGSSLMNALFLVYDSLEIKHRQCIFLLTGLTPDRLSHKHIMSYLQSEGEKFANECIEKLLMLSLMEKVPHSEQYQFNKFLMKFIRWLEEPKIGDTFKQMMRRVWGNEVQQYIKERRIILNEKRSVQLATQIGSNKGLVNSLLPLLGKNYKLMPLFEHALNIIEEQFCHSDVWYTRQKASDLIFAYSYLTKAVYCPEYHPTSLLINVSYGQTTVAPPGDLCSDACSKKLMKCGKKLEILYKSVQNDIEVAEAFAHYSALLMLTSCKDTKWKPFLFDLAMIVVTANSECKHYCQRTRRCSCGSQSPIELGLFKFLTNERNLSKHHLQEALVRQTTHEYQHCQTILKTLAIMTIHRQSEIDRRDAPLDSVEYFQRMDLNYSQLDPTCFLGVIEDIILPFLNNTHPKQDAIETLKEKHQILKRELTDKNFSQNGHPSSRYATFFGLTALKLTKLQEELEWPEKVEWIRPREAWVCSIIKDKTRNCQDSTRLPLFDQVKSKEAEFNDRMLLSLKYLMDKEEFSKWDEKVQKIPWFYQLMSI